MDDGQLMALLKGLNALSDKLATEGRFVDASIAAGGYQAIRGLRARLDSPDAPAPAIEE